MILQRTHLNDGIDETEVALMRAWYIVCKWFKDGCVYHIREGSLFRVKICDNHVIWWYHSIYLDVVVIWDKFSSMGVGIKYHELSYSANEQIIFQVIKNVFW